MGLPVMLLLLQPYIITLFVRLRLANSFFSIILQTHFITTPRVAILANGIPYRIFRVRIILDKGGQGGYGRV